MVVFDDVNSDAPVMLFDKGADKFTEQGDRFGEYQIRLRAGAMTAPRVDRAEPLAMECAHFVECVRTGHQPRTDALNGLRVVATLEAAQQSMLGSGKWVDVRAEEDIIGAAG